MTVQSDPRELCFEERENAAGFEDGVNVVGQQGIVGIVIAMMMDVVAWGLEQAEPVQSGNDGAVFLGTSVRPAMDEVCTGTEHERADGQWV